MIVLRDLQQYVVLAEELNFRIAAERLHVSQPTLSQTLQRLERHLGTALIERSTRRSHLTEAGQLLLERARLLLSDARILEQEVKQVGAGHRRQLRVGAVNPAMRALIPRVLKSVHHQFPELRIHLQPDSSFSLVRALREGRLDLAIVRTADGLAGFRATPLMNDPLLAAVPAAHPLANQPEIRLSDLSGEQFIMAPRMRNPEFHDELVSVYRRAGCSPAGVLEVSGLHSQLALIGAGVGVAVQSLLYRDPGRHDIVFRPIGQDLRIPLQVLAPEGDDSAATASFTSAARSVARQMVEELSAEDGDRGDDPSADPSAD